MVRMGVEKLGRQKVRKTAPWRRGTRNTPGAPGEAPEPLPEYRRQTAAGAEGSPRHSRRHAEKAALGPRSRKRRPGRARSRPSSPMRGPGLGRSVLARRASRSARHPRARRVALPPRRALLARLPDVARARSSPFGAPSSSGASSDKVLLTCARAGLPDVSRTGAPASCRPSAAMPAAAGRRPRPAPLPRRLPRERDPPRRRGGGIGPGSAALLERASTHHRLALRVFASAADAKRCRRRAQARDRLERARRDQGRPRAIRETHARNAVRAHGRSCGVRSCRDALPHGPSGSKRSATTSMRPRPTHPPTSTSPARSRSRGERFSTWGAAPAGSRLRSRVASRSPTR